MTQVSFVETNLAKAELIGANISQAKFIFTNLAGTNLEGTNLEEAYINNVRYADRDTPARTCADEVL